MKPGTFTRDAEALVPSAPDADGMFSTAAIRSDLPTRSVRAGFVNLGSQATQIVLGIGGTMVLARLLTPADFGIYAMVGTLMVFVGNFRDFGLPLATMHRETVNHHEYSALFWLYQRFNLLLVLFMLAMGPVVAWFYGQPALTAITAVMAVGVFTLGLAVQQEGLLKRQMRFGALTVIDVTGTVLGIVLGISAALLGASYWALVMQFLAMCIVKTVGCWAASGWRPSRVRIADERAAPGLRKLLAYGKNVTAARMVNEVGRNLDRVLVGYFAGAQPLGLYHHAFKWSHLPAKQVYGPLSSVAISGLSRVQNEPELYRTYFYRGLLPVFAGTLPVIAFLFAEAHRVIGLLLGSQWLDAVPLFRILCVAAFVGKITTVIRWLYLSSGETRRQLHWNVMSTPVMIAAVSIGAAWGARGVALGFTAAICLLVYPSVWFCLRRSHVQMRDFFRVVWRPATASIVAAAVVIATQTALAPGWPAVAVLLVQLLVFAMSYLTIWMALPGGWAAARDVLRLAEALPWKRRSAPSPEPQAQ